MSESKKYFTILCIIALNFGYIQNSRLPLSSNQEVIIVETQSGRVQGNVLKTWKQTPFFAFRGIRYAEPPIGEFRFKDPIMIKPWSKIFNGRVDGPMCPQPGKNSSEYSEDCLRLNVYTKAYNSSKSNNSNELKPVLVYIPGGGLYVGSGVSSDYGGPYYLMEHDIVLVTLNYRLGLLGFLNLGTKEYPGNAGYKDQVVALRWLRDNIKAFGGDPHQITLLGNSAGAFSIAMHMVSPMTQGLFHRAILGSGGIDMISEKTSEQTQVAEHQANLFNCTFNDTDSLLECLMSKETQDYVDTTYETFQYSIAPWTAVIEETDFGHERYLVEQPKDSFLKGSFMKIPIMTGVTKDELAEYPAAILKDPSMSELLDNYWDSVLPKFFGYESGTENSSNISKALRAFYGVPSPISAPESMEPLSHMISDGGIGFSVYLITEFMKSYQSVYYYQFSYVGRYSHLYYPGDEPYGAEHSDDFIYLLCRNRTAPIFSSTDPEAPIIEKITRLISNFVIKADPNDQNDQHINEIHWRPLTKDRSEYLNINVNLTIQNDMFKDRYSLWDTLFPFNFPTNKKKNVIK